MRDQARLMNCQLKKKKEKQQCFGFLSGAHFESYLPLGNGGKATDFNFLSSAAVKQFLMVSSSCSSHLSEPHCGMWQWMTNLAASPLDWVSAAATNRK